MCSAASKENLTDCVCGNLLLSNRSQTLSCVLIRNQDGAGPVVHERKSQTLPVSRNRAGMMHARLQQLSSLDNSYTFNHSKSSHAASIRHASELR